MSDTIPRTKFSQNPPDVAPSYLVIPTDPPPPLEAKKGCDIFPYEKIIILEVSD
jgi:hypothetical protein